VTGGLIASGRVIVPLSAGRGLRDKDLLLVDEERAIDRYGWTYYRAPVVPPGGLSRSPDKSEGGKGAAVLVPSRGMVSPREISPTKSANPGPAAPLPHPVAQSTALRPQAGNGMPQAGKGMPQAGRLPPGFRNPRGGALRARRSGLALYDGGV